MPETPARKRFIAGAVCPQCEAEDRLVVYVENRTEYQECVACGYLKAMSEEAPKASSGGRDRPGAAGDLIQIFKPED